MCAFAVDNLEHLAPWEPLRRDEYFTTAFWSREIDGLVERADAGTGLSLLMLARDAEDGPVVGRVTLSNIVRGVFQAAHLGYAIDHRHEGRGLMHEALLAVTDHAFTTLELHRLMANYMPTNERSARLLRRLGFTPEGYARDYLRLAGRWQDHVLTSLIAPEPGKEQP
jgi:ribosomal-protein-alanine N-acetyltransferase